MIRVSVYLEQSNPFSLIVTRGGVGVNLINTGVTRVVVVHKDGQIDSAVDPTAFDWTTEGEDGVIEFDFGSLTTPLEASKVYMCTPVLYDPNHSNGQVWHEPFQMIVRPKQVA